MPLSSISPNHVLYSSLCTPPGLPLPHRRPSPLYRPPRRSCTCRRRSPLQTPTPCSSTFPSYGCHQALQKNRAFEEEGLLFISCPGGSVACPIPGDEVSPSSVEALEKSLNSLADWFKVGFECVELETELNSCGGCLALGSGQDCALIENARTTGCENGSCQVYSCFDGYVVSPDRTSCVKRGSTIPATPVTAVNVEEFVADDQLPFGQ